MLDMCISQVKQGIVDELPLRIARSVKTLTNFIAEFELNKGVQRPKVLNPDVKLTVNNSVAGSQGPTKIELNVPQGTSIEQIIHSCAGSIFPKRAVSELNLVYKGRDLREPLKTLREITGS